MCADSGANLSATTAMDIIWDAECADIDGKSYKNIESVDPKEWPVQWAKKIKFVDSIKRSAEEGSVEDRRCRLSTRDRDADDVIDRMRFSEVEKSLKKGHYQMVIELKVLLYILRNILDPYYEPVDNREMNSWESWWKPMGPDVSDEEREASGVESKRGDSDGRPLQRGLLGDIIKRPSIPSMDILENAFEAFETGTKAGELPYVGSRLIESQPWNRLRDQCHTKLQPAPEDGDPLKAGELTFFPDVYLQSGEHYRDDLPLPSVPTAESWSSDAGPIGPRRNFLLWLNALRVNPTRKADWSSPYMVSKASGVFEPATTRSRGYTQHHLNWRRGRVKEKEGIQSIDPGFKVAPDPVSMDVSPEHPVGWGGRFIIQGGSRLTNVTY